MVSKFSYIWDILVLNFTLLDFEKISKDLLLEKIYLWMFLKIFFRSFLRNFWKKKFTIPYLNIGKENVIKWFTWKSCILILSDEIWNFNIIFNTANKSFFFSFEKLKNLVVFRNVVLKLELFLKLCMWYLKQWWE